MAIPTLEQKLAWLKPAPASSLELELAAQIDPAQFEIGFQRTNDILDEGMDVFVRSCRCAMGVAGGTPVVVPAAGAPASSEPAPAMEVAQAAPAPEPAALAPETAPAPAPAESAPAPIDPMADAGAGAARCGSGPRTARAYTSA